MTDDFSDDTLEDTLDNQEIREGDSLVTPLSQDYTSPASPLDNPEDGLERLDSTHPATDSNLDAHELYDEGLSGAAEAEEPGSVGSVESDREG